MEEEEEKEEKEEEKKEEKKKLSAYVCSAHEWMHGWMDGWTDEWINEWMNDRMVGFWLLLKHDGVLKAVFTKFSIPLQSLVESQLHPAHEAFIYSPERGVLHKEAIEQTAGPWTVVAFICALLHFDGAAKQRAIYKSPVVSQQPRGTLAFNTSEVKVVGRIFTEAKPACDSTQGTTRLESMGTQYKPGSQLEESGSKRSTSDSDQ
ncbi:hypothetical protein STEG23_006381, partial [Scotinomys teguina]